MARIKKTSDRESGGKQDVPAIPEKDKRLKRHTSDIKNALAHQDHNGWKTGVKRTMALFTGHLQQYNNLDSKYLVSTYLNLVNLILPNLYFKQPYVVCQARVPKMYIKGKKGQYTEVDGERCALLLSGALNDAFTQLDIESEVRKVIQDAISHGWGVMKVGVKGYTLSGKAGESQAKKLFAQRINPLDLPFDPMATNPGNAKYLIHRFISSKETLRKEEGIKDSAIDKITPCELEDGTKPKEIKDELKDLDDENMPLELFEYHDQVNNRIYTYGKGKDGYELLKERDNPHTMEGSHFITLRFTGDNDEWSGISMLLAVEDEALAVNQMVDRMVTHFQRFPGVIVHEPDAIPPSAKDAWENCQQGDFLEVSSGAISGKMVEFQSPSPMGQEYFSGLITFNQLIDRVHGIPDFQRGGSRTRKTATENLLVSGDANVRRDFFVEYVKQFVIQVSKKLVALIQQYYDEEEVIKITGEFTEWPKFTKENIQGEYLLDFDVTEMVQFSQTQAQGIMQMFQALATNQEAMAYFNKEIDIPKLCNLIARGYSINLASVKKSKPMIREVYDPYAENEMVAQGKRLPDPLPHEPHDQHQSIHEPKFREFEALEEQEKAYELKRHIDMHGWMQSKMAEQPNPSPSAVPQGNGPGLQEILAQAQSAGGQSPMEAQGGFNYPSAPANKPEGTA